MVNKWIYRPSLCLVVHPWRKNDLPYRSHKLTVRRSFHGLIMNDVCWAKGTPQTTKNVSSIFCWIKFARIYFQLDFWYFHTAKRSLTVAWRKMQQCCLLLSFLLCLQDWRDVVNSKDRTSSRFRRASTKIHTQQKQRTSKNVKKKHTMAGCCLNWCVFARECLSTNWTMKYADMMLCFDHTLAFENVSYGQPTPTEKPTQCAWTVVALSDSGGTLWTRKGHNSSWPLVGCDKETRTGTGEAPTVAHCRESFVPACLGGSKMPFQVMDVASGRGL